VSLGVESPIICANCISYDLGYIDRFSLLDEFSRGKSTKACSLLSLGG
jgi:hypothetical protein